MAAHMSRSFADSIFARLIALMIAFLIGGIFLVNWADDVQQLVTGNGQPLPMIGQKEQVKPVNAGLQQCLAKRVGDVEKMKTDGIINSAQYLSFRQRAEELCRVKNPG